MSGTGTYPKVTAANYTGQEHDGNAFKSRFTDESVTSNWTFFTNTSAAAHHCGVWKLDNDPTVMVVYCNTGVAQPTDNATTYNVYFSHADAAYTSLGGNIARGDLTGAPASGLVNGLPAL